MSSLVCSYVDMKVKYASTLGNANRRKYLTVCNVRCASARSCCKIKEKNYLNYLVLVFYVVKEILCLRVEQHEFS